jgi:hypothetical protein
MSKRGSATAEEKRHMRRVAEGGCILCRNTGFEGTPAEVHHIRTGVGAGRRSSNMDTIGLCFEHHRGNTGVHGMGRKAWERTYGTTELDLLAQTIAELYGK